MDLSKHLEKADEAVKRRNYPLAVKLYTQLLGLQPDYGDARSGLRNALFKQAAVKPPSKVFAILGGGFSLLTAKIAGLCGGHRAAAKAYERYLTKDPLAEGTNLSLARSLQKAGLNQSALAVYRSYAEHEPRCLEASREAGLLLSEAGDHGAALAMLEQALKVDPRDQESLRARKNLAAEGALKSSGLETAESSRDLIKDKAAARRQERAGRLQLSPEEIETELDELDATLAASPEDVAALTRAAELHTMRNDDQSALDSLERAMLLAPDRSELASRAGDLRIRLQEGRVQEALARGDSAAAERAGAALGEARMGEFKRRVGQNPTDLGLRFDLGQALLTAGRHDDAIAELQQAVKDPRKKVDAQLALGRAFRGKGLSELAENQLEKAFEAAGGISAPLGRDIAYELGEVAETAGNREAALRHYQRILEHDIGFRDVDKKIQRLRAETS